MRTDGPLWMVNPVRIVWELIQLLALIAIAFIVIPAGFVVLIGLAAIALLGSLGYAILMPFTRKAK